MAVFYITLNLGFEFKGNPMLLSYIKSLVFKRGAKKFSFKFLLLMIFIKLLYKIFTSKSFQKRFSFKMTGFGQNFGAAPFNDRGNKGFTSPFGQNAGFTQAQANTNTVSPLSPKKSRFFGKNKDNSIDVSYR